MLERRSWTGRDHGFTIIGWAVDAKRLAACLVPLLAGAPARVPTPPPMASDEKEALLPYSSSQNKINVNVN